MYLTPTPARRVLSFGDLGEIVAEAESLHATGYDRAGRWDLAQVCDHLADWLRFPVDGFPPLPWFLRPVATVVRYTVGPGRLRRVLKTGAMPKGVPTLPATVHPSSEDEAAAAVARLAAAVERFRGHAGPYRPSPLFGPLDRDAATRLQLVHAAHHLGFLVPRSPA